jgi:4-hydroxyproline epimerase
MNHLLRKIHVIDSHTAGEPTRTVIAGAPDLGGGTVADQLKIFRDQHDAFRSAVVNEPRGSDVMVGALLVEPADRTCITGVIFFNNVGVLGMCGHGTIGIVTTLAYRGLIAPGEHRVETCVGIVTATLHPDGRVSVANVPAYRRAKNVCINVPGLGPVTGDVAWGGNWFFLVSDHGQTLSLANVERLTNYAWKVRQAINAAAYPEIDHIELFGPPTVARAHSRNFVLCPGKAYLAADGKLTEGEQWIQEGILGTTFIGTYKKDGDRILPTITGRAFITAESNLILDAADPFCDGIRS